jgi:hypothetical protein
VGRTAAPPSPPSPAAKADQYGAFISYSHAVDGLLAASLQKGLQRFAKPWNRVRALRVFRDQTSLSADPALWAAIERALTASSAFILMASPESAHSRWVAQEVSWWCSNKPPDRMLIALTGGELEWSDATGDFDWTTTTALPPVLRGTFRAEPKWVDFRWAHDVKDPGGGWCRTA